VLRLRHLAPSGLLCFVFLEGAIVLGVLLALAELVSWWGVLVLPATVALMVKFNDMVTGSLAQHQVATETATARATVLRPAAMPAQPETASSPMTYGYASAPTPAYGYPNSADATGYARSENGSMPVGYGVVHPPVPAAAGYAHSGPASDETVIRGGGAAMPAVGAPVRRQWADQMDVRQQMARQSAVRRYE
jgi:hypothetical protein